MPLASRLWIHCVFTPHDPVGSAQHSRQNGRFASGNWLHGPLGMDDFFHGQRARLLQLWRHDFHLVIVSKASASWKTCTHMGKRAATIQTSLARNQLRIRCRYLLWRQEFHLVILSKACAS